MSATTGKPLSGEDHLRQSVADILTTPIGSRVGRRDYGSLLFDLIDQPFNALGRMRLYAAAVMAIMRWEPRLSVTAIDIRPGDQAGAFILTVEGRRNDVPFDARTRLTVPIRSGATSLPVYA